MGSWELHIQSVGVSGILRALVGEFWWRVDWYFDSFFMLMRIRGNQLKKKVQGIQEPAQAGKSLNEIHIIHIWHIYIYPYVYMSLWIKIWNSRFDEHRYIYIYIYIPVFSGWAGHSWAFGQWPCASHVFFFRSTNGGDLLHVFGCSWNDTGHGVAATRGITRNSPRFRRIFVHSTAESSELCGHAKPEPATKSSQS